MFNTYNIKLDSDLLTAYKKYFLSDKYPAGIEAKRSAFKKMEDVWLAASQGAISDGRKAYACKQSAMYKRMRVELTVRLKDAGYAHLLEEGVSIVAIVDANRAKAGHEML